MTHAFRSVKCVIFDSFQKSFIAYLGIMKIRDGFIKSMGRVVAEITLESAKGFPGLIKNPGIVGFVIGLCMVYEQIGAPILSPVVPIKGVSGL